MYRTLRFGFVLSPEEKAALERVADVTGGLSLAALLGRLTRQEARSHGLWPCTIQDHDQAEQGGSSL